jgi:hypothetical protein
MIRYYLGEDVASHAVQGEDKEAPGLDNQKDINGFRLVPPSTV